jgi:hypothetical protein
VAAKYLRNCLSSEQIDIINYYDNGPQDIPGTQRIMPSLCDRRRYYVGVGGHHA